MFLKIAIILSSRLIKFIWFLIFLPHIGVISWRWRIIFWFCWPKHTKINIIFGLFSFNLFLLLDAIFFTSFPIFRLYTFSYFWYIKFTIVKPKITKIYTISLFIFICIIFLYIASSTEKTTIFPFIILIRIIKEIIPILLTLWVLLLEHVKLITQLFSLFLFLLYWWYILMSMGLFGVEFWHFKYIIYL